MRTYQGSDVRDQASEKPHLTRNREEELVIASAAKQSRKCAQWKNRWMLRFARNDVFLISDL